MTAQQRSLAIAWEDPLAAAQQGLVLTGLEAIEAVVEGEIDRPPIAALLGFELHAAAEGCVSVKGMPGEQHYSTNGAVHGGFAAAMLDSAMYLAVHSTLPRATFASTLEIKVNYVRPITAATGPVVATGRVVHGGRQLATAAGEVTRSDGKLLAHGTTTCLIRVLG